MTDLSRREFFRTSTRKVAKATIGELEAEARNRAKNWIRPPYALDEFEFLTACTRCSDCIEACPHNIIFPLSSRLGAMVVNTPALDLVNKGCHLCTDWPCISACETGALNNPSYLEPADTEQREPVPKIALANLNQEHCLAYLGPECGACASSCPIPGALIWSMEKPDINADLCVGCGLCREACIVEPKAIEISSNYRRPVKPD